MTPPKNAADDVLKEAQRTLSEGRLDEAVRHFVTLRNIDPASPWSYLGEGDVARKRHQYDIAFNNYVQAEQRAPKSLVIQLRLGATLIKLQRFDEALRHFIYVLQKKPGYSSAIVGLGEAVKRSEDWVQAVKAYDLLASEQPEILQHKLDAANILLKQGEWFAACARYQSIVDAHPDCFQASVGLGEVAQAAGDPVSAIGHFERARLIKPKDNAVAIKLANALLAAGRIQAAQAALDDVMSRDPSNPRAIKLQTRLLDSRTTVDGKRALLRDAALVQSKKPEDWARLARFVADNDGLESGLEVLDEAESIYADNVKLLITRSEIYYRRGMDDAGDASLDSVSRLFPDDPSVQVKLIERDISKGRYDEAATKLIQYPEGDQSQRLKRFMLTAALEERRWRLDSAAQTYREAIDLAPSHVQAYRGLARVDVLRMRPVEAKRSLEAACRLSRGPLLLAGKSVNSSQSLVGEFVNDLRSDPSSLERAQSAYETRSVAAALQLVRDAPDFTGAAMTLLMLLRRCNMLDGVRPSIMPRTIPRSIVQFWDSDAPPDDVIELMDSWKNHNKTWQYRRFSTPTATSYILERADILLYRAWRAARSVAQRADLFRLVVLAREGGVYADADDRCVGSIDAVTERPKLLLWHEQFGSTGNNFMAVSPRHPVVELALAKTVRAILRGDGESIWLSTGPGLLTRCAASYIAESESPLSLLNGDMRIIERHELKEICSPGCKASYKTTGRHWQKREFSQRTI